MGLLCPLPSQAYHCGFFFKFWDQLFGTTYKGTCTCARCDRLAGNRTRERWEKVVKYDYSVLLSPKFWAEDSEYFSSNFFLAF